MNLIRDLRSVLNFTVVVAGLGYFVDLFDITLFGVVRVASLRDLGITDPAAILSSGLVIYNSQMAGMMIGGILWGVIGDRKGRLSVLFGSILLYSFANIASAFAWDVPSYAVFRFLGGVGLAGELGAAITLVSESLPKEKRGLGTTIVAALGMLGIIAAALVGQLVHWKTAYILGGIMGLLLLLARFKISESTMFEKKASYLTANPFLVFTGGRFRKYLSCILIGVPTYFTTGILFTFAPELTAGLGVKGTVTAGNAILFGSFGLTLGDILAGLLSQWLRSRKRAIAVSLVAGYLLLLVYVFVGGLTSTMIYVLSALIGTAVGYWAVLVTMAAEQFGTNIRATVATTVPNFVRGSAVFAASLFAYLKNQITVPQAALAVGTICFGMALLALTQVEETFGRDLDYEEGAAAGPM
ncbi:MAG TPA: MFS transporter [Gemmatimonadaceae bacterium]|nr:MFS transporter [Gemmatimonadaceae bacterium]